MNSRLILAILALMLFRIEPATAKRPYTLTTNDWQEITREHLQFLEGAPADTPLKVL